MAIFDEIRWDTLEYRIKAKALKTDLVYFAAFVLNWVTILDQWILKSS